ncbi:ABC transporter permease [Agromyces sp. SYSU T0242]|uniref:ABC transporter permease n=1 Tax=Agromyces litoreus TaxID=3158561 RepID=UPI00339652F9
MDVAGIAPEAATRPTVGPGPTGSGASPRARRPWGLVAASVAAVALAAIPIIHLVVRVASADPAELAAVFDRPRIPLLVGNSVLLAGSVTATAVVLGVPSAFLLARARLRWRGMWAVLAALPLAMPSYLAAYGWLAWQPSMKGFWAAWLVLSFVSVPYVTLPVAAALRIGSTGLDDVARTLGRGPLGSFMLGTWPQIRPAVLAGALLVCLYTLSDFGGVALFRFPVLTTAIQQAYSASFSRDEAAVLAVLLVTLALLVVLGEQVARGRAARRIQSAPAVGRRRMVRLGRWTAPAMGLLVLVPAVGVVVPVAVLLGRVLTAETVQAFDAANLGRALANTVMLSAGGAVVAVLLALPIGVLAARYRGRLVRAVESAGYLALGLPGIVVGLSLVFFSLSVVPALYQTALVLAFGYGVLFMPKAIGSIRSATAQVPTSLEDLSRTLGNSRARTWWAVTARLARPGIFAAALLAAVSAMKELPATLMLRPTGTDTLATELWQRTDISAYGAAAPYAVALLLVAAVPAFLLSNARAGRVATREAIA